MGVLMIRRSGSWHVYIANLTVTCLSAKSLRKESQMEQPGITSDLLPLSSPSNECVKKNARQVPNIWWYAGLELHIWRVL